MPDYTLYYIIWYTKCHNIVSLADQVAYRRAGEQQFSAGDAALTTSCCNPARLLRTA